MTGVTTGLARGSSAPQAAQNSTLDQHAALKALSPHSWQRT